MRTHAAAHRTLLAGLVTLATAASSAALSWADRAPLIVGRGNHGAGVIDNTLYVAGGGVLGGFSSFASTDSAAAYDPATDSWSRRASMATRRAWPAAAVADVEVSPGVFEPRLFVIGGIDVSGWPFVEPKATIEVYDPVTDQWSGFGQDLPHAFRTVGLRAVTIDNLIYVMGGADIEDVLNGLDDQMLILDPIAGTVTTQATSMPRPAAEGALVAVGRQLFYIGGWEGQYGRPTATVDAYDVDAASWRSLPPLPFPIATPAAVAVGDSIVVAGGWDGNTATYADVFVFDVLNETWDTDQPLMNARSGASAHVLDVGGTDHIYVAGGVFTFTEVQSHEFTDAQIGVQTDTTPPDFAGVANAIERSCTPDMVHEIELSWTAATDPTPPITYNVYRSTMPVFTPDPSNLHDSGLIDTTYVDSFLLGDCGVSYTYIVRAVDGAVPPNEDPNTVATTVTLMCVDPPAPPDVGNILLGEDSSGEPNFVWTDYVDPAAATHYHLYRTQMKELIPTPGMPHAEPTALTWSDPAPSDLEFYEVRAAIDCGDIESAR